jgi:RNA polymerase sigma-70 factor (ECF subfamily)
MEPKHQQDHFSYKASHDNQAFPHILSTQLHMTNSDEQLIQEILEGGSKQELAIRIMYKKCFYIVREGKGKFPLLDQDDLLMSYNSAIIAVRKQIVTHVFRGDSAIATYLHKIFTNRCIDVLRNKFANRNLSAEYITEMPDESPDILSKSVHDEQIALVRKKIDQLGGVCAQILLLSEYEGYTAQQIAETIGFSNANSVNSKKHCCLQKLKVMLEAAMYECDGSRKFESA